MPKNIITPGDQFAEKGTTPWADWQRSRMKHALKDTRFESKQIVQVIRDMCAGEEPAWHLMTRHEGKGFRTFKEFVTDKEGLAYGEYPKFKALAISDPGTMNEREYDLLTAAPALKVESFGSRDKSPSGHSRGQTKSKMLRAIRRTPPLVRKLYVAGLIDAKLAELLGPDEKAKGHAERQQKARRALLDIQSLVQNGDDAAYRRAVNEAVRRAFERPGKTASLLERVKQLIGKLTAKERKALLTWMNNQ